MVIIDDASSDDTALLVKSFSKQAGGKIQLLQRQLPQAQTGKGNALNWAYQQVVLSNRDPSHLICGVLDADAYMAEESYLKVIQYFAQNEKLDLHQTRVGMLETRNWLQIMQDIEFTVINDWIQNTRNRLGNAAASGNGQFIRVSSVSVQRPWGNALLEDLALCQILLMLVKEFYMILIKALNRTCLFGAFFEADGILFQSNSLQKVSEIRIAIGCAFNLLDFTINAL